MRPDVRFVAFLRNVNLGQPRSPTRAQLETAFLQAGAATAVSFLSNGTLLFSIPSRRAARPTARRAGAHLQAQCGLREPIFVCDFQILADLAAADPFAAFSATTFAERAISFFEPPAGIDLQLPLESERRDCLVFRAEAGLALSITRTLHGRTGYPTPVLEKALGVPVTTRGWNTILRLLKKHG